MSDNKKKLFVPRGLSGENSRWLQWNKEQPKINGKPINQYTHDGTPVGYWKNYSDDDGVIIGKGMFINGKKHGLWHEYWGNRNLAGKGLYINGKEEGIWEFYDDETGELNEKRLFKNGKHVKHLPLTESELPKKKKLFVPRNIDERAKEYEGIIKQRLEKIRNSPFGKVSKKSIFEWIQENNLVQDFKTSFKSPPLGRVAMTSFNPSTGEVTLLFEDEGNNNVAIKFKIKDIQIGTIDINPNGDDMFYPID